MTFIELGMDRAFAEQAGRLELYNPSDIMSVNLPALKKHPEFTYLWYADALDLLQRLGLLRDFQKNQL